MTLYEQIKDFVSLGWKIEFSHEPMNMTIKVSYRGTERESWLPLHDHCAEEKIVHCIAFMVDEILNEKPQPPLARGEGN